MRFASLQSSFATFALAASIPSAGIAHPFIYMGAGITSGALQIANGPLCVTYAFDANGNRISRTQRSFGTPGAVWGSGYYACFNWSP